MEPILQNAFHDKVILVVENDTNYEAGNISSNGANHHPFGAAQELRPSLV